MSPSGRDRAPIHQGKCVSQIGGGRSYIVFDFHRTRCEEFYQSDQPPALDSRAEIAWLSSNPADVLLSRKDDHGSNQRGTFAVQADRKSGGSVPGSPWRAILAKQGCRCMVDSKGTGW